MENELPSRRLAASLVDLGLPRFLSQSRRTVRILLSHCLSVGQILAAVYYDHQCTNLRSVHGHVGEDASGMGAISRHFRGHLGLLCISECRGIGPGPTCAGAGVERGVGNVRSFRLCLLTDATAGGAWLGLALER